MSEAGQQNGDTSPSADVTPSPDPNVGRWRLKDPHVCRIFFSSPFNGMEKEREALTSLYWPQIQSKCNAQGVQFVPVDMRWGITEEHAVAAQTINICLREIDRSDMFVGFFGTRYGWYGKENATLQENVNNAVDTYPWLDDVRDRSVTEIEFLRGHLNKPGDMPAYMCFRDQEYDAAQREDAVKRGHEKDTRKFSVEDETAAQKLEDLKRRVKETENDTVGINLRYSTPTEGAKDMFEAIDKVLTTYLLAQKQFSESERVKENIPHAIYRDARSGIYVGGDEEWKLLDQFVDEDDANKLLLVGEVGSGKSAFLSKWLKQREEENKADLLFYHFVGANSKSRDISSILRRVVRNLRHELKSLQSEESQYATAEEEAKADNDLQKLKKEKLKSEWDSLMKDLDKLGKKTTIVLDGLDRVNVPSKITRPLFWIPKEIPKSTKFIVSTQTSDHVSIEELIEGRKYEIRRVPMLPLDFRIDLCQKHLDLHGKALSEAQMLRVVSAEQGGSPLFLKITIDELFRFGSFRALDAKIDDLTSSETTAELFDKILDRLEADYQIKEYQGNLVEKVTTIIAISRDGITENRIREIYDIPYHVWSTFYYGVEKYLVKKEDKLDFAYPELHEAVRKKYLSTENEKELIKKLALLLYKEIMVRVTNCNIRRINDTEVVEMCWYVRKIGDKRFMTEILSQYSLVESMLIINRYELFEYLWFLDLPVEKVGELIMNGYNDHVCRMYNHHTEMYADMSELPGKFSTYLSNLHILMDDAGFVTVREQFLQRRIRLLANVKERSKEMESDMYHTMYNLACYYTDIFEPGKALPLHYKAKEFFEKVLSETENPTADMKAEMGYIYNGLGLALQSQDQTEEAVEYYKKSMEVHENNPDHGDSVTNYNKAKNNLGRTYLTMKDYQTAIKNLEEVVKAEEDIYLESIEHDASYALTNLGICYRKVKQFDKAKVVYDKALHIKKMALGETHKDVAIAYINMSNLALDLKRYDEMEIYLKQTLDIYQRLGQSDVDSAWKARENLVLAQLLQKKEKESEAMFWQTVERYLKREELERFALAGVHRRMLNFYFHGEDYENAYKLAMLHFEKAPKLLKAIHFIIFHMAHTDLQKPMTEERTMKVGLKRFPEDRDLAMYYCAAELMGRKAGQDIIDFINNDFRQEISVVKDILDTMDEEWPEFVMSFLEGVKEKYRIFREFVENLAGRYFKCGEPGKALELCGEKYYDSVDELSEVLQFISSERYQDVRDWASKDTKLPQVLKAAMIVWLNTVHEDVGDTGQAA